MDSKIGQSGGDRDTKLEGDTIIKSVIAEMSGSNEIYRIQNDSNLTNHLDIRFRLIETMDYDVFQSMESTIGDWLAGLGALVSPSAGFVAKMAFIFKFEIFNTVVRDEKRTFTKSEETEIRLDIRTRLEKQLAVVLEYGEICSLGLKVVGEPCLEILAVGSLHARKLCKYTEFFYHMVSHSYDYRLGVPVDAMLKSGAIKLLSLFEWYKSDLPEITEGLNYGVRLEGEPEPKQSERPTYIRPRQALERIVEMVEYLRGCQKYLNPTISDGVIEPPDRAERIIDTLGRPVLGDSEFTVLMALYELNQPVGVRFVKNRANLLGGNFVDNSEVSKLCSALNKEYKFAQTLRRQWSITDTGKVYVKGDLRYRLSQDSSK